MKLVLILVSTLSISLGLTACSSAEKKSSAAAVTPAASHDLTSEDITAKYSLSELNSAANLLKVVVDQAGTKPSDDKGSDLIGCPLTGVQAMKMSMPVKYLIDQVMRAETEAYIADPKNYATEKGFETCAASCVCGVLSDVIEAADESSLPPGVAKSHARNQQRLSVKAKHQTSSDSLACAKKQAWFCSSDLRTYLEKAAARNAQ